MKRLIPVLLAALLVPQWAAAATAVAPYSLDEVAHLSCSEAWQKAGQSVDNAFGMIETMSVYLLQERNQTFPDNQETGKKFGLSIDQRCKSDPDQLMLNAVDAALREVSKS